MPFDANAQAAAPRLRWRLEIVTPAVTAFIDLTDRLAALVAEAGVRDEFLYVQTRHTTTGMLINEAEPLLLDDLAHRFACWAPADGTYGHDDFSRRTVNLGPAERTNGAAHCRAALLRASESVLVEDGGLSLGRWQRVLLAEFDGPQHREVEVWFVPAGG